MESLNTLEFMEKHQLLVVLMEPLKLLERVVLKEMSRLLEISN